MTLHQSNWSYRLGWIFFDAASHPSYIIRLHTLGKGVQAGCVVGAIIGVPYVHFRRKSHYGQSFWFAWSGVVANSAFLGSFISLFMYALKSRDTSDAEWLSLAIRVQNSRTQNLVDLLCWTGIGIGSLIGAITMFFAVSDIARVESSGQKLIRRMIRGASVGCAGGVFTYFLLRHRLLSTTQ